MYMWVKVYFCLCVGCTGAVDVGIGAKAVLHGPSHTLAAPCDVG